ncbi:hypothetical protein VP01_4954g1 [Puccinia sorghi]|uniref:Uncharacterized protein n=1 Tax=Puccinia sorghi TaxID=27349 RepID=A0A0L6ULZ2_9BASI|nr:hypothetical protein VP01_4954g1 [Puccinia sorghi]
MRNNNTNPAANQSCLLSSGLSGIEIRAPNTSDANLAQQAGVVVEPNTPSHLSGRIGEPTQLGVNSCATSGTVPRAISLMDLSQDLNANILGAATNTIFKYSAVFGGFNLYKRELILSSQSMRPDLYEDTIIKLQSLENRLVQNVIHEMRPNNLLDTQDFDRKVD